MAEGARQRALDQDGILGERIEGARFRPAVRSVPVVLDGPSASAAAARTRPGIPGAVVLTALAVALVLIGLVGVLALWSGSGGSAPAPTAPLTGASTVPSAFPSAPPSASRAATAPPSRVPPTTSAATPEATPLLVSYEVQRGERMAKIARKFGISRADIIAANDLGDPPRVEVGQVIVLPFPPGSTPPPGTEPVTQAP
jgi:LysM repeat protein